MRLTNKVLSGFTGLDFIKTLIAYVSPKVLYVLLTGNDGDVTIATVSLFARNWRLNETAAEKETTNSSTASGARDFLADRAGAEFSCEAYIDSVVATITVGGAAVAIELIAIEGTTDKAWTFNAVILQKEIICGIAGGDALLMNLSGRVSGAITETQLT